MGRDRDRQQSKRQKEGMYKFVSSILEDHTADSASTYGVQFAWKPCVDYLKGGGSMWKNGGPRGYSWRRAARDMAISSDAESDIDGGEDIREENVRDMFNERWRDLFVTCNGVAVRVYTVRSQQKPMLLQTHTDDDPEEQLYCVAWTYNVTGNHEWWVCTAGKKGVLRVINVQRGKVQLSLIGHGEAINDIKVHPKDPALVLTASKDESLRLWNLRTGSTVAIYAGLKGHRGEVVHADFNADGSKFASCGIDNSVRIWDLYDNEKIVEAIIESHKAADRGVKDPYTYSDESGSRKKAKVPISQFPFFVTRKVHKHYVDCVMWVGDLLLSKSVHNRIFLWQPERDRESLASPATEYTLLEEYVLDECNVWFIRFALNRQRNLVACGNKKVRQRSKRMVILMCKPVFSTNIIFGALYNAIYFDTKGRGDFVRSANCTI